MIYYSFTISNSLCIFIASCSVSMQSKQEKYISSGASKVACKKYKTCKDEAKNSTLNL